MERDWLASLPEDVRAKAAEDLNQLDTLQQRLDQTQRYEKFYTDTYLPWVKDHGTTFEEYERQREAFKEWQSQGSARPERHANAATTPATDTPIDWDHPDAVEKAYSSLAQQLERERQERVLMQQTFEVERDNLMRIMTLQEQAYGLLNNEVIDHLKARDEWTPRTDIRAVAQHARDKGYADLTQAHQDLYRADHEKDIEKSAYERGLRDAEARLAKQSITTEMGEGTPPLMPRRQAPQARGYGNAGIENLMQQIAERRTARRMANS